MEKKMSNERFFRLVLRVLASHVGPIHKCVLRPNADDLQNFTDVEEDVNTWLRLLSVMDVKDLAIDPDPDMQHDFMLPPNVFQCLALSCLTLRDCKFYYSIEFRGFPNLTRLDLYHVEINDDMLEKVISNCPLEMLFMIYCLFWHHMTDIRPCMNAISASSLRVLDIVGYGGLYNCYLKCTTNLKVASLLTSGDRVGDDCIASGFDVLMRMPNIEVLTYSCCLHTIHASNIIPKALPELLGNLKTVSLRDMDAFSANEISLIFCIMRSSPNLENLEIHMKYSYMSKTEVDKDSMGAVIAYLEVEAKEEIRTGITTVTVSFESARKAERMRAEIALMDSIVSCCPALGKLFINRSSSVKGYAKLQLSRALKRYGHSSSKPKIVNAKIVKGVD